jgi:hypothetical protein
MIKSLNTPASLLASGAVGVAAVVIAHCRSCCPAGGS